MEQVEETLAFLSRNESLVLYVERGSLSATDPSRVAQHVRVWDIAVPMMRSAGSRDPKEDM